MAARAARKTQTSVPGGRRVTVVRGSLALLDFKSNLKLDLGRTLLVEGDYEKCIITQLKTVLREWQRVAGGTSQLGISLFS